MAPRAVSGNGDSKKYAPHPKRPNPSPTLTKTQINAALPSATPSPTHTPVILIDVREPAELTGTGIIPSAVSIPLASQPDALYLTADEFETRFGFPKPELVEGAQMVFYCKAGVRAWAAAQMAVQAGYDPARIGVYDGSWLDWERNGGKVEKWDGDDY
jgi:rhodanese-related sulfurtransferase